jgi:AcrR family transcriptional regulator
VAKRATSAKSIRQRKQPTQARGRQSIADIIDATERVLRRDGPAHITTPAIAAEAGVSIGAIYHYYPNKESIILALYEGKLAGIRAMVETPIEPVAGDWREGVRRWIHDVKAREAASGYDLVMEEAADYFPALKDIARSHAAGQARALARHLRTLGSPWPDDALFDLALHAFFLNSSLWLYWSHAGAPLPQGIDRLAEVVAAIFSPALDGALPPPRPYAKPKQSAAAATP